MLVLDALALSIGILALIYETDYTHTQTNQPLMQCEEPIRSIVNKLNKWDIN